jgi:hypothetical protein
VEVLPGLIVPGSALKERMTGFGIASVIVTLDVTFSDQASLLSWTLKEIVWLPTESDEVVKEADVPISPSMLDVHL